MAWRARLAGLWRLMHPGPSLLTVLAFDVCALLAARGRPEIARLAVATLGLVCMQFSISALNDYCDRAADALQTRKRKPIVAGLVPAPLALWLALALAAGMVLCFAPFGAVPLLLAATFLALGFAYDLGVKSTPASGLMHGLAFPTIPLLAWALFATLRPALFWAFPLGLAIGVGLHLADALPDAEDDARAGVRGLTQVLGPRALAVCWGAFAAADIVLAGLAAAWAMPIVGVPALILAATTVAGLALLAGAVQATRRAPALSSGLKQQFVWLASAALVAVAGWLTAVIS